MYAWYPSQCSLETWNATKFSQALGKRTILFVGDSIEVQQYFSLRHMMISVTDTSKPEAFETFSTVHGGNLHLAGAQFLVGASTDLTANQSLETPVDCEWIWRMKQADIFHFNTGHHWHRRDMAFLEYDTMVWNVIQRLAQDFKGTHVIFRTSNWGHHECQTIAGPLANFSEAVFHLENGQYEWSLPIWSEKAWSEAAQAAGFGDKFYYNNASITALRGDAHTDKQFTKAGLPFFDCLHNCHPGSPDLWNWLLYNTLVADHPIETEAAVQMSE